MVSPTLALLLNLTSSRSQPLVEAVAMPPMFETAFSVSLTMLEILPLICLGSVLGQIAIITRHGAPMPGSRPARTPRMDIRFSTTITTIVIRMANGPPMSNPLTLLHCPRAPLCTVWSSPPSRVD